MRRMWIQAFDFEVLIIGIVSTDTWFEVRMPAYIDVNGFDFDGIAKDSQPFAEVCELPHIPYAISHCDFFRSLGDCILRIKMSSLPCRDHGAGTAKTASIERG
jgi:hypothetical protein